MYTSTFHTCTPNIYFKSFWNPIVVETIVLFTVLDVYNVSSLYCIWVPGTNTNLVQTIEIYRNWHICKLIYKMYILFFSLKYYIVFDLKRIYQTLTYCNPECVNNKQISSSKYSNFVHLYYKSNTKLIYIYIYSTWWYFTTTVTSIWFNSIWFKNNFRNKLTLLFSVWQSNYIT